MTALCLVWGGFNGETENIMEVSVIPSPPLTAFRMGEFSIGTLLLEERVDKNMFKDVEAS